MELSTIVQQSFFRIIMVNGARSFSGIGRYAKDTLTAFEKDALLISLAFSREDYESGMPGNVFKGIYPPVTSGWFINTKLQGLVFRQASRFAGQFAPNTNIIHYVDPYVFPFFKADKTIVSVLDIIPLSDHSWAPKAWIKYARKCLLSHLRTENIVTCSNKVKREIEDYGFSGKINVVYPYVNASLRLNVSKSEARKTLGLPEDRTIILSISSSSQRKNLNLLKSIMEELDKKYLLVRVGSDIGIGKNFKNIDDSTLNKIYRAADVLLFPTLDEGFGYPLAEAMANGLPVVTTNLEVTREVTRDAAVLSDPTTREFVESIKEALNNAPYYSRKSFEVSKYYIKEKYAEALGKVYNEL